MDLLVSFESVSKMDNLMIPIDLDSPQMANNNVNPLMQSNAPITREMLANLHKQYEYEQFQNNIKFLVNQIKGCVITEAKSGKTKYISSPLSQNHERIIEFVVDNLKLVFPDSRIQYGLLHTLNPKYPGSRNMAISVDWS